MSKSQYSEAFNFGTPLAAHKARIGKRRRDDKARLAHAEIGVTDWAVPTSLKGATYARLYLGMARPAMKAALAALPVPLRHLVARLIPA